MDIQRKCFEESNNVNPDWSFKFDEELQQYIALDSEMELQVNEFNELWDAFRAGWQAAKAQAVPDGYCIVPKEPTHKMMEAADNCAINGKITANIIYKAMIEAQEPAND